MATEQRMIDMTTQRMVATNIADTVSMATGALDRLVPISDRIALLLIRLASAGAVSAAVIWAVLADWRWPLAATEMLLLGAVVLVLLGPAMVLLAYRRAFLRFAAASDRLRSLSGDVGDQAERLYRAAVGLRATRRGDLGEAVRALRELRSAAQTFQGRLDEFAPLVAGASPAFLAGTVVSAIVVPVEVVLAGLLLGWMLLF